MAAAIQFAEGGDGGLAVGDPISVNGNHIAASGEFMKFRA